MMDPQTAASGGAGQFQWKKLEPYKPSKLLAQPPSTKEDEE